MEVINEHETPKKFFSISQDFNKNDFSVIKELLEAHKRIHPKQPFSNEFTAEEVAKVQKELDSYIDRSNAEHELISKLAHDFTEASRTTKGYKAQDFRKKFKLKTVAKENLGKFPAKQILTFENDYGIYFEDPPSLL